MLPEPIEFAPVPSSERHRIQSILMEVIAEKTGYPAEMLNPEMGLDADLGIDSIKPRRDFVHSTRETARRPGGQVGTLGHA